MRGRLALKAPSDWVGVYRDLTPIPGFNANTGI